LIGLEKPFDGDLRIFGGTGLLATDLPDKFDRFCNFLSVYSENSVRFENAEVTIIREMMVASTMNSVLVALCAFFASSFRARAALQAEILALRHQLAVLHKNAPPRLRGA
jgi:hypothetical protein